MGSMPSPMKPEGSNMDVPPPQVKTARTLLDTQRSPEPGAPPSPHAGVMLGMSMIEQGTRIVSLALPGLAPALVQMVEQLKQVLPRAMNEGMAPPQAEGMPPPPEAGMPPQAGPQAGMPPGGV